jgi:hypothetical protein
MAVGHLRLPAVYVLRWCHIVSTLDGNEDPSDVTLWLDSTTVGIEAECFCTARCFMRRVSRILVWQPELADALASPTASALGAFAKKLGAYEPALVDHVRGFVKHGGCDGLDTRRIGERSFHASRVLTAMTLPRSITCVGSRAFFQCSALTEVTLPDTLTHIGERAFAQCPKLTSLTLPNSLTHVGKFAFAFTGLKSVTLPSSLAYISESAFAHCTMLTDVTLPNALTHIGDSAFNGCTRLAVVTLSNSLIEIGEFAFAGCASLSSMTLPDSLTRIGANAFFSVPLQGSDHPRPGRMKTTDKQMIVVDCKVLTRVSE